MNKENKEQLKKIEKNEYFGPTKLIFEQKFNKLISFGFSKEKAMVRILDYLYDILTLSQSGVEKIIDKRFKKGIIKDKNQTRKSVGGNNFQKLVAYSLLKNIQIGNLPKNIVVTLTTSNNKIINEYATINTFQEKQKPDVDILIYSKEIEKNKLPIVIFSCKTSMRERAGQTYKWKLLLDIATTQCKHISETPECPHNIYQIEYNNQRKIYMCFVTSDLYNEINQPQIAGMLSFFDKSYITKSEKFSVSNLENFSKVVCFLNNVFKND